MEAARDAILEAVRARARGGAVGLALSAGRDSGAIAVAYETVQLPSGELPLLTPMSEGAGRMAVQEGATVGSWVTFGVLMLTLVASALGALAGIPSLRTWRWRWAHTGAA